MERDIFFAPQSPDEEAYTKIESHSDKNPHSIRGHHIKFYFDALQNKDENPVKGIREYVQRYVKILANNHDPKYRKDMFGEAPTSVLERKYMQMYDEFVHLDDNDQIIFVEGQKDRTCETCPAIGEHCLPKSPADARSAIADDAKGLDSFMKKADELGINADKFTITKEAILFPDTHPGEVRIITTTAGVVKEVLRKSSREDWMPLPMLDFPPPTI